MTGLLKILVEHERALSEASSGVKMLLVAILMFLTSVFSIVAFIVLSFIARVLL